MAKAKIAKQEYAMVPISELKEHPANPRRGAKEPLAESIQTHGFYGAVVAQKSTGLILAGNHRYREAVEQGITKIPCFFLDCSDAQAKRILLADNRTSDLGAYDDEALATLLQSLSIEAEGLTGTGYQEEDLNQLLASLPKQIPSESPHVSANLATLTPDQSATSFSLEEPFFGADLQQGGNTFIKPSVTANRVLFEVWIPEDRVGEVRPRLAGLQEVPGVMVRRR